MKWIFWKGDNEGLLPSHGPREEQRSRGVSNASSRSRRSGSTDGGPSIELAGNPTHTRRANEPDSSAPNVPLIDLSNAGEFRGGGGGVGGTGGWLINDPYGEDLPSSHRAPMLSSRSVESNMSHVSRRSSGSESGLKMRRRSSALSRLLHKDATSDRGRVVYFNDSAKNSEFNYDPNYISTTKYHPYTFVIQNLFEQFLRIANFYFVIVAILTSIPAISPIPAWTSWTPVVFVLSVTMFKEAVEDWKRYKTDVEMNNYECEVLRDGEFEKTLSKHIVVGDIVRVSQGRLFPADLVILASSLPEGICYVNTMNLDGETNLKCRNAVGETSLSSSESLANLSGSLYLEAPSENLMAFEGAMYLDDLTVPIGLDQLLLRGTSLQNTEWACGIVGYTGHDSKIMRNATASSIKRSKVEKLMNSQLSYIFVMEFVACFLCAVLSGHWLKLHEDSAYYLALQNIRGVAENILLNFWTFVILFSIMVPISLYVSLELVKVLQKYFVDNDILMYDEESDTPAKARTSNLNEELGQIDYIFTDKTGTLTQNDMILQQCIINGEQYGSPPDDPSESSYTAKKSMGHASESDTEGFQTRSSRTRKLGIGDHNLLRALKLGGAQAKPIKEFFTALAICHTVIPEYDKDEPDMFVRYQAASPDEGALVLGAKALGFTFTKRTTRTITVDVLGKEQEYDILALIEFNSDRKRMSIVVGCPDMTILLICKGADSAIFPRLREKQPDLEVTERQLQEYGSDGLRTLCIATAVIDPIWFAQWFHVYQEAITATEDRQARIDMSAEAIEKNMRLLGATAIEDRLQDGVPATISHLRRANINIWMLTGDKQETAVNVGLSCSLLDPDMNLIILDAIDKTETQAALVSARETLRNQAPKESSNTGLIIGGECLSFALEDFLRPILLEIAQSVKTVVCCRSTPLQKALVVKLVKEELGVICLAVGDGANDVGMIQEAHVGVGIGGKEGMHAVLASDYSIGQFRFLRRLLLLHGRLSYKRISKLILYCFYKNMVLSMAQFWFAIFCGYSGQSFFDGLMANVYNLAFTSFPILAVATLDKDMPNSSHIDFPEIYTHGQRNTAFNRKLFWAWMLNAVWHSVVCFFLPLLVLNNTPTKSGRVMDLAWQGTVVYSIVVVTVNLKLAIITSYWTWINHVFVWGSILDFYLGAWIYSSGYFASLSGDVLGWNDNVFYDLRYWLLVVICPAICLIPDLTQRYIQRYFFPLPKHIIQERKLLHYPSGKMRLRKIRSLTTAAFDSIRQALKVAHTGFAFSQEPGEGKPIIRILERLKLEELLPERFMRKRSASRASPVAPKRLGDGSPSGSQSVPTSPIDTKRETTGADVAPLEVDGASSKGKEPAVDVYAQPRERSHTDEPASAAERILGAGVSTSEGPVGCQLAGRVGCDDDPEVTRALVPGRNEEIEEVESGEYGDPMLGGQPAYRGASSRNPPSPQLRPIMVVPSRIASDNSNHSLPKAKQKGKRKKMLSFMKRTVGRRSPASPPPGS